MKMNAPLRQIFLLNRSHRLCIINCRAQQTWPIDKQIKRPSVIRAKTKAVLCLAIVAEDVDGLVLLVNFSHASRFITSTVVSC